MEITVQAAGESWLHRLQLVQRSQNTLLANLVLLRFDP